MMANSYELANCVDQKRISTSYQLSQLNPEYFDLKTFCRKMNDQRENYTLEETLARN